MKQINLSSASSNANDETSVDYRRRKHMDLQKHLLRLEDENSDLIKKNDELETVYFKAGLEAEELRARLLDLQELGDNFDKRVEEEVQGQRDIHKKQLRAVMLDNADQLAEKDKKITETENEVKILQRKRI